MTDAAAAAADPAARWAKAALVLSALAVLGSLALTWLLGLTPCSLCYYQRTFAMALLGLFAVGTAMQARPATLCAIGLPMAIGGFGVAIFHVWLEGTGKLDCPAGLLGLGSAPVQSLFGYLAITPVVTAGVVAGKVAGKVQAVGVALGLFFAVTACTANGAMPKPSRPTFDAQGHRVLKGCVPHWTPANDPHAVEPKPGG